MGLELGRVARTIVQWWLDPPVVPSDGQRQRGRLLQGRDMKKKNGNDWGRQGHLGFRDKRAGLGASVGSEMELPSGNRDGARPGTAAGRSSAFGGFGRPADSGATRPTLIYMTTSSVRDRYGKLPPVFK